MGLKDIIMSGRLYREFNEGYPEEELALDQERIACKDLVFEYNNTKMTEVKKHDELLSRILGGKGKSVWIEAPMHMAYGSNVYIGDHFYANFNMVLVDDGEIHIGNNVMFAPNVTISTTGHPVHPALRAHGTQFSLPVYIEDNVWIGSNVVILPGVRIGKNSVIGAGSIVTKDIPANVVAVGNPCRVLRKISDHDLHYYHRDKAITPEELERYYTEIE